MCVYILLRWRNKGNKYFCQRKFGKSLIGRGANRWERGCNYRKTAMEVNHAPVPSAGQSRLSLVSRGHCSATFRLGGDESFESLSTFPANQRNPSSHPSPRFPSNLFHSTPDYSTVEKFSPEFNLFIILDWIERVKRVSCEIRLFIFTNDIKIFIKKYIILFSIAKKRLNFQREILSREKDARFFLLANKIREVRRAPPTAKGGDPAKSVARSTTGEEWRLVDTPWGQGRGTGGGGGHRWRATPARGEGMRHSVEGMGWGEWHCRERTAVTANRRGLATSFWRTVATAQAHVTAGHEGDTSIRASTTFPPSPPFLLRYLFPPASRPLLPFRFDSRVNLDVNKHVLFSSNLEASGKEYNIGNNIGY